MLADLGRRPVHLEGVSSTALNQIVEFNASLNPGTAPFLATITSYGDIAQRINNDFMLLQAEFASYPQALEELRITASGFWPLGESILTPPRRDQKRKLTFEERAQSAIIQHTIVRTLLQALHPASDEKYTDTVFRIWNITNREMHIHETPEGRRQSNLASLWSGTRHEAAASHVLLENGWKVYIPETKEQAEHFDVAHGIDMIVATPQGDVILLDIKGRKTKDGKPLDETVISAADRVILSEDKTDPQIYETVNAILLDTAQDRMDQTRRKTPAIIKATCILPSSLAYQEDKLPYFSEDLLIQEKKRILERYLALKPEVAIDMLQKLTALTSEEAAITGQVTMHSRRSRQGIITNPN